jgi:hypothetical protein
MSTIHWILLRGLARYSDHWRPFEQEYQRGHPLAYSNNTFSYFRLAHFVNGA